VGGKHIRTGGESGLSAPIFPIVCFKEEFDLDLSGKGIISNIIGLIKSLDKIDSENLDKEHCKKCGKPLATIEDKFVSERYCSDEECLLCDVLQWVIKANW